MNTSEPPFLFGDISAYSGPSPNLDALAAFPHMAGIIAKAYQPGVNDGGWFAHVWRRMADLDGLRGAYCYLDLAPTAKPGKQQAEGYLRAVAAAGGWIPGRDILPICDAERGKPTSRAWGVPAQQVVDTVSSWAELVHGELGRPVMYYGRGILRDLKITSRMGCEFIWDSGAVWPMPKSGLETVPLDDIALWQYAVDFEGSTQATAHGLALGVPAFGSKSLDMSVFIDGVRPATHEAMIERLVVGLHADHRVSLPWSPAPAPAPSPNSPTSPAPVTSITTRPSSPPPWVAPAARGSWLSGDTKTTIVLVAALAGVTALTYVATRDTTPT